MDTENIFDYKRFFSYLISNSQIERNSAKLQAHLAIQQFERGVKPKALGFDGVSHEITDREIQVIQFFFDSLS